MLTTEQVADLLQVTPDTVRRLVASNRIRCRKVNRRVFRFDPDWVEAFIQGTNRPTISDGNSKRRRGPASGQEREPSPAVADFASNGARRKV
jgi:excisionase family DNA binding protein